MIYFAMYFILINWNKQAIMKPNIEGCSKYLQTTNRKIYVFLNSCYDLKQM